VGDRAAIDPAGLLDMTDVVLKSARVTSGLNKGANTHRSNPVDQGKSGSKMHVFSGASGLPLAVGI
jgi:hypothetical protein